PQVEKRTRITNMINSRNGDLPGLSPQFATDGSGKESTMRLDAILDRFALPDRVPLKLFLQLAEPPAVARVEPETGKTWTYAQLAARARAVAAVLRRCQVGPGDRVAWTAPTGIDSIAIWMAIASVGAVDVCVGDGIKGLLLEHIIE